MVSLTIHERKAWAKIKVKSKDRHSLKGFFSVSSVSCGSDLSEGQGQPGSKSWLAERCEWVRCVSGVVFPVAAPRYCLCFTFSFLLLFPPRLSFSTIDLSFVFLFKLFSLSICLFAFVSLSFTVFSAHFTHLCLCFSSFFAFLFSWSTRSLCVC